MASRSDRSRSLRSRRIDSVVDEIKAEGWTTRRQDLVRNAIHGAVYHDNIEIAVTTFNLLRLPFNIPRTPGNTDTSHASYCLETLLCSERLREFLELADQVNQLTTAFCASRIDPELYWQALRAQFGEPDPPQFFFGEDDDLEHPELWSPRLCIAGHIRLLLRRSREANLSPDGVPVDSEGTPINDALFARVQRAFWQRERETRIGMLLKLAERQVIQLDRSLADAWAEEPRAAPVDLFADLVVQSRLELACSILADDPEGREALREYVSSTPLADLGVQGLARLLPTGQENYTPEFLIQTCIMAGELSWFYATLPRGVESWRDGWFERVGTLMLRVAG
ncbi:hypothetical protein ACJ41O_003203 [Fusarium nematophilum]